MLRAPEKPKLIANQESALTKPLFSPKAIEQYIFQSGDTGRRDTMFKDEEKEAEFRRLVALKKSELIKANALPTGSMKLQHSNQEMVMSEQEKENWRFRGYTGDMLHEDRITYRQYRGLYEKSFANLAGQTEYLLRHDALEHGYVGAHLLAAGVYMPELVSFDDEMYARGIRRGLEEYQLGAQGSAHNSEGRDVYIEAYHEEFKNTNSLQEKIKLKISELVYVMSQEGMLSVVEFETKLNSLLAEHEGEENYTIEVPEFAVDLDKIDPEKVRSLVEDINSLKITWDKNGHRDPNYS